MSKDRQNPTNKSQFTKPKPSPSKFDTYLRNQQKEKSRLKKDLHTVIRQEKVLHSYIIERNRIIVELEKSIQERDSEILKSNIDINQLKEKNVKTLEDFSYFKNNFYQLEAQYDQICQSQKQENDELKDKLQNQQNSENQKIVELSSVCQNLEQQLKDKTQSFLEINENLLDTIRKFDQMKENFEKQQIDFENYKKHVGEDFEKQQIDFENYKKHVGEEKKIYDENNTFKFAELNKILNHKDNIIKKYMADNENLENEKNRIIDELNNKIYRIERAFNQPTKAVQPIQSMPNKTTNDIKTTEISNEIVTKPRLSESVETQAQINLDQSPVNNEIQKPNTNLPTIRQYKFKRPSQHPSSYQNSSTTNNNKNNRKRHSQPVSFSSTSSDSESDDDSICQRQWRPKQRKDECFVPDTSDASEGFAKPKRAKK